MKLLDGDNDVDDDSDEKHISLICKLAFDISASDYNDLIRDHRTVET